jgi:hypothetical protein
MTFIFERAGEIAKEVRVSRNYLDRIAYSGGNGETRAAKITISGARNLEEFERAADNMVELLYPEVRPRFDAKLPEYMVEASTGTVWMEVRIDANYIRRPSIQPRTVHFDAANLRQLMETVGGNKK